MNGVPVAIAIGAVLGALSRYYITLLGTSTLGRRFPYGTLFVNLSGTFLIGLASVAVTPLEIAAEVQKLFLVGFLGSYTTFSSYILEAVTLLQAGRRLTGWLYWLGSPLLGLGCVELGRWLGQTWL